MEKNRFNVNSGWMLFLRGFLGALIGLELTYYFAKSFNIFFVLIFAVVFFLCSAKAISAFERRSAIIALVFSALLSAAFFMGNLINTELKTFSFPGKNNILCLICFWIFIFSVASVIFSYLDKIEGGFEEKKNYSFKKVWLISFVVIFLLWLPYYLTFYPGITTYDSVVVIGQATEGNELGDWHPIVYTLLARMLIGFGKAFWNITVGVGIFALAQTVFLAAAMSYGVAWLTKYRASLPVLGAATLYFALSPTFAILAMTLWKDIPFAAMILNYTLFVFDIVGSKGEKLRTLWGEVSYVVLSVVTALMRHNGYYVIVIMAIVIFAVYRKKTVKMLPALLCSVLLVPVINSAFYAAGVTKSPFSESLSIPAQQIAYTYVSGGDITDEQMEIIERMFDTEKLRNYDPLLADPAKNSFNSDYLEGHKGEFIKLWVSLMPRNLKKYACAYLMQTVGYWAPGKKEIAVDPRANSTEGYGVEKINLLQKCFGINLQNEVEETYEASSDLFDFPSIASMMWILFFCVAIVILRKNYMRLFMFLPTIGVWATLMVAAPTHCSFRYIMCLPLVLPFLIFVTLKKTIMEQTAP